MVRESHGDEIYVTKLHNKLSLKLSLNRFFAVFHKAEIDLTENIRESIVYLHNICWPQIIGIRKLISIYMRSLKMEENTFKCKFALSQCFCCI